MSMQQTPRKLLVTSALPYANGSLHIGHILEHVQADIWVRFQKMLGRDCIFISGEDAHGTPVMLAAQKRNISPEALVTQLAEEHKRDLSAFYIDFDNFYTTHSLENEALIKLIYQRMKDKGDIYSKVIQQAYDP
ncbi:MAG: methionine--tRNA ligase, partial [Pseudomonadota bacterium]